MKRTLISFLLLITAATVYAQQIIQPDPQSADVYRKKAKDQRVSAIILGSAGFATLIYGFSNYQPFGSKQEKFVVPFIAGTVLLASTIPFIIASDRNRKKAKKLSTSFMLQPTPPLIAAIISTVYYPSIHIRINL